MNNNISFNIKHTQPHFQPILQTENTIIKKTTIESKRKLQPQPLVNVIVSKPSQKLHLPLSQKPSLPSQKPSLPSQKPSLPSQKPSLPSQKPPPILEQPLPNPIMNIDIIYYINLDHRTDRNADFLREIDKLNLPKEKIKRISGVYLKDKGHLGCSKSHILVMEDFIANNYRNCIVFEDDFTFVQPLPTVIKMLNNMESIPFDVCMLSTNEQNVQNTTCPFLKRGIECWTTSGYMVSQSFAPQLLANFKEGCQLLEENYSKQEEYCIDQYWTKLQPISNWYLFEPKLGKQRPSYSDISRRNVGYGV
jgi:hypothetical protein